MTLNNVGVGNDNQKIFNVEKNICPNSISIVV